MLLCKYLISFHFSPGNAKAATRVMINRRNVVVSLFDDRNFPPVRNVSSGLERACCVRARDYFLLLLTAVSAIRFHVLLHYITRPVRRRERKENQRLDNYNGKIDFSLRRWSCKVHSRTRNNEAKINFNSTRNNPRSRTAGRRSVPREI